MRKNMNEVYSKKYLKYSKPANHIGIGGKVFLRVRALLMFPIYWLLAYWVRTPGLNFRWYAAQFGARLLFKHFNIRDAYRLMVYPMDSVRYFEFNFMWRAIKDREVISYLDVSSPRLFPLVMVDRKAPLVGDLINPAKGDLSVTMSLAGQIGLTNRCRFHEKLIDEVSFQNDSFDVITCISVLEHIPDDKAAVTKMWSLVRPGGRLLISIPCAAKASEEYINIDEYELLDKDENGFVYYQRYYDQCMIQNQILEITGLPKKFEIYAEKQAGNYDRSVTRKREDINYPYEREAYMMGIEYEYRENISALPGIAVIAMEFVKSEVSNEK